MEGHRDRTEEARSKRTDLSQSYDSTHHDLSSLIVQRFECKPHPRTNEAPLNRYYLPLSNVLTQERGNLVPRSSILWTIEIHNVPQLLQSLVQMKKLHLQSEAMLPFCSPSGPIGLKMQYRLDVGVI